MSTSSDTRVERVRLLNDSFRRSWTGGIITMTASIQALGPEMVAAILTKVRIFDAFSEENDPHGEHDFGSFDHEGERIFWKLDYYDRTREFGSDDPSDPTKTCRVMTIMLASDY